jgi:ribosomal protein S18 acetylase RimI-like enzyme
MTESLPVGRGVADNIDSEPSRLPRELADHIDAQPHQVSPGLVNGTISVPLYLRCGVEDDMDTIIGFIDQARGWLRTKGTDQWDMPWPDREARDERVLRGLHEGNTWIAEDHRGIPIATITYREHANELLWTEEQQRTPAAYVSRLIVDRNFAGQGIGAALNDWAGLRASREWGAGWIRIDVWTTNDALQSYYVKRDFISCGTIDFPAKLPRCERYPSAALFEKPIGRIDEKVVSRFFSPSPRLNPHARSLVLTRSVPVPMGALRQTSVPRLAIRLAAVGKHRSLSSPAPTAS